MNYNKLMIEFFKNNGVVVKTDNVIQTQHLFQMYPTITNFLKSKNYKATKEEFQQFLANLYKQYYEWYQNNTKQEK